MDFVTGLYTESQKKECGSDPDPQPWIKKPGSTSDNGSGERGKKLIKILGSSCRKKTYICIFCEGHGSILQRQRETEKNRESQREREREREREVKVN